MCNYNFNFLIDELKASFQKKRELLLFNLHIVGWQIDVANLSGDDPDIDAIVVELVQSSAKRREFEQMQHQILSEDASTFQEMVSEQIFMAAILWYSGLHFVASDWCVGVKWLIKSLELIDLCRGMVEHAIWQQTDAIKKEKATHGGKAKAAMFSSLKAEVIRLLQVRQLEGGWKSKEQAINAIHDDLYNFIRQSYFPGYSEDQKLKHNQTETYDRIPRLISDWSRYDVDVKAAFDVIVERKKKSGPKSAE